MKKSKIRRYPFVDQKGPAKETQTFILSYAYGNWTEEEEKKFLKELSEIDLRFYKEKCIFRDIEAFKIIIMDKDVVLESILKLI